MFKVCVSCKYINTIINSVSDDSFTDIIKASITMLNLIACIPYTTS